MPAGASLPRALPALKKTMGKGVSERRVCSHRAEQTRWFRPRQGLQWHAFKLASWDTPDVQTLSFASLALDGQQLIPTHVGPYVGQTAPAIRNRSCWNWFQQEWSSSKSKASSPLLKASMPISVHLLLRIKLSKLIYRYLYVLFHEKKKQEKQKIKYIVKKILLKVHMEENNCDWRKCNFPYLISTITFSVLCPQ